MVDQCADCGLQAATVFLPEGRYLCRGCWERLRALRQDIHIQTSLRWNARLAAQRHTRKGRSN